MFLDRVIHFVTTLGEIIKEWDEGERDNWVYSCDPNTGKISPGLITWAGETRKNADVIKITLDNGKSITTTPDHKWVHRTKGFVEAQHLNVGDSLMPFYKDTKPLRSKTKSDYERVWDNHIQEWVFTHRMVTDSLSQHNIIEEFTFNEEYKSEKKLVRHHKDFDRFNNNPTNLVWMGPVDHFKYHQSFIMETIWSNPEENIKKQKTEVNYNHKIVNIEWLEEKIDTGTITVDGNEIYHNYHTFATDSGVFIKNSNLDQIADIEYIQRKLFTALRVPKPFLGFEETSGEGKNLAMMDVRFARTINRVQQAMIQELNKIAIIHLYVLGFEDDLENFTLGMANPSTQADILKIESWKEKVTLYRDLVADAGNGFGSTSMTWAKKNILGFSDDEIVLDLEQQRIEKAAANEIQNTGNAIPTTGIFDKVDKLYGGIKKPDMGGDNTDGEAEGGLETGGAAEGGFGGGNTGGFGGGETELGGGETDFGGGETGGETPTGEEGGEPLAERDSIITEDVLDRTVFKKNKSVEDRILTKSNKVLNEDIKTMIDGIDKLLD